jgi:hypothetical protein
MTATLILLLCLAWTVHAVLAVALAGAMWRNR